MDSSASLVVPIDLITAIQIRRPMALLRTSHTVASNLLYSARFD